MSAAMPQPTVSPLDHFVREDVLEALMNEGFKRAIAESAVSCATGVTFSEMFRSALDWAHQSRANGRPITPVPAKPVKEKPMQTSVAKPNGHTPTVVVTEKRCAGFERECTEIVGGKSTTGLCSACYARKKYTEKYSAAARGKTAKQPKGPKEPKVRRAASKIIDAPPQQHLDSPRVTLAVTEPQLNQFLVRLSLEDKQRLANYYLATVEAG